MRESQVTSHVSRITFSCRSEFYKVGRRRQIEQFFRHRRFGAGVDGNVNDLIAEVAGMHGAEFAVTFDVPLLQKIRQALLRKLDAFALAHPPEYFGELFVSGVDDLNFVPQAA